MKTFAGIRWALRLGLVAALVCVYAGHGETQNPNLKPTFGEVTLKAGFTPDPFTKDLVAGGKIKTKLGGVNAWIANAPDFRLHYTAGSFPLTFRASSKGDVTLLINLPDGTWLANDDGGKGLNSKIRLANPKSGRYDIYVGTYVADKKLIPAKLSITELK